MDTTEEMLAKLRYAVEVQEVGRDRPLVPRKDAFTFAEMILEWASEVLYQPRTIYAQWSEATGHEIALTDEECIRLARERPYSYPYLRAVFAKAD